MSRTVTRDEAALFMAIASQVEAHPESYGQEHYSWPTEAACKTTECIAGHALVLTGHAHPTPSSMPGWSVWTTPGGRGVYPDDAAGELLGLNEEEMSELFAGSWLPAGGLTVPGALRRLADGATIAEVSA